jgi:hypothetical protein
MCKYPVVSVVCLLWFLPMTAVPQDFTASRSEKDDQAVLDGLRVGELRELEHQKEKLRLEVECRRLEIEKAKLDKEQEAVKAQDKAAPLQPPAPDRLSQGGAYYMPSPSEPSSCTGSSRTWWATMRRNEQARIHAEQAAWAAGGGMSHGLEKGLGSRGYSAAAVGEWAARTEQPREVVRAAAQHADYVTRMVTRAKGQSDSDLAEYPVETPRRQCIGARATRSSALTKAATATPVLSASNSDGGGTF